METGTFGNGVRARGRGRGRVAAMVVAVSIGAVVLAACGSSSSSEGSGSSSGPVPVRLGYFPNITHAPAIAGVDQGFFAQELGSDAEFSTATFNAGPEATEALFSGAIDMTYIGPNPSINAFQKSNGEGIRIIAGSTSGGASLVVKPDINSAADLKGKVLATPQLGNTQDVALRSWLKNQGLQTDVQGGGDVSIRPQENSQTLQTFQSGDIDGAWVPEPWATRLVQEGGGKVLVDERTLWPGGRFVTTNLIVRKDFLDAHSDLVEKVLKAHVKAVEYVNADPAAAQQVVNNAIKQLTGKALPDKVVQAAWGNMTFTENPIASSLYKSAQDANAVGLLESTDVQGIYDLGPLNTVLQGQGQPTVSDS